MDRKRWRQNGTEFSNSIQQSRRREHNSNTMEGNINLQFTKEETEKGYNKVKQG